MKPLITLLLFSLTLITFSGNAQHLKIPQRKVNALTGSAFAASIRDSLLSLSEREELMLKEVEHGNVPDFYRSFLPVTDTANIEGKQYIIKYFVAPDYLVIGSDKDYFYAPLTAAAAQKIANKLNCSLPTRKMSDRIYQSAIFKLTPEPIPPSMKMMTVPVFEDHNRLVHQQLDRIGAKPGSLVAGNKKDVIISNKIAATDGTLRVVIYGWHKPDGKAIQPLYNGHKYDWVDYSHGIRLIQNQVYLNGRKTTIKKILKSKKLNVLLSDEDVIRIHYL
ncbi:MAG: hypothetical protein P0Y49_13445 [Candidatus Pedobacter colombiensis]|uniref:Uncharacterized protein n=1 Tax=Candidatus Pedobacter colombiensis TaxID=3121371 RepID=A0AAJ5W635_9SPHI|nr:hypothetical protein [Pedobacter sp.]WEK17803.1 MAG: hypothetical protein P0Y49_13445 [Pedobacter sp.]